MPTAGVEAPSLQRVVGGDMRVGAQAPQEQIARFLSATLVAHELDYVSISWGETEELVPGDTWVGRGSSGAKKS